MQVLSRFPFALLFVFTTAMPPGDAFARPGTTRPYRSLNASTDIAVGAEETGPETLLLKLREMSQSAALRSGRTLTPDFALEQYFPRNRGSALFRVLAVAGTLSRWLGNDGVPYRQHSWPSESDQENLKTGIDCSRSIWFAFTRATVPYNETNRYLSTLQMVGANTPMREQFEACPLDRPAIGDVLVYRGTTSEGRRAGHTVMVIDPERYIAWGSHGWDGSPLRDTGVELQVVTGGAGWKYWDTSRMPIKACWRHRAFEKRPLTVSATPPDARVRIMNIKPKYARRMSLEGGWYDVMVDRRGCTNKREWVWHDDEAHLDIDLECKPEPLALLQDRLKSGETGPRLIVVPKGSFKMGGRKSDEKPLHRVQITRAFAMGQFEVTLGQYLEFCRSTGVTCPKGRRNRPVTMVSWKEATAYAKWLSEQTQKKYRLPTEAEWEYAARAGTTSTFWWGSADSEGKAICSGCSKPVGQGPRPVGATEPNRFKLYDMAGNVYEWVRDAYRKDAYKKHGKRDPFVARGDRKVRRGGGWRFGKDYVRSGFRGEGPSNERRDDVGFRVVREL